MMYTGEVLVYIAAFCICNPATTLMDRQQDEFLLWLIKKL